MLARFTPFVEIGASTFIKACHIGVGTRSLYFRKTILGVIGQYGHRLMNSFFKTIRLRGTAVNFFVPRTEAVAARALIAFDGQYLSVLDWDKQDVRHSFLNSHSPTLSCYNPYAIGNGFRSRRNRFRGGGFTRHRNRHLRGRLRRPPALQECGSE